MRSFTRSLIAVAVACTPVAMPVANAQDAPFGCKVLLCGGERTELVWNSLLRAGDA
jgi:hypothetical protein